LLFAAVSAGIVVCCYAAELPLWMIRTSLHNVKSKELISHTEVVCIEANNTLQLLLDLACCALFPV
jgi:hypothetical protein